MGRAIDLGQPLGEGLAAGGINIEDLDTPRACRQHCASHSRSRAARAQLQNARQRYARQAAKQTITKTRHVGVMANKATIANGDGIDGAGDMGALGQFVEQRHDLLLEGVGHVKAAIAFVDQALQQSGQGGVIPALGGEIEQVVGQLQPLGPRLLLVQPWRARGEDIATDQSGKKHVGL